MGCSTSKIDDEEIIRLCKDRKRFIEQAVEQRIRFASGHTTYIQSLRRVAAALHNYVEGGESREFLDSCTTTSPFTPIKKPGLSPKSLSTTPIQSPTSSTINVNYLRSGGNPAVSVERSNMPETMRIESYSPMQDFGIGRFITMQSSPLNSSSSSSSPNNRPCPPSPQTSPWDFFWNPFTSLEAYGYTATSSPDHPIMDNEITELRWVCEEGVPDLEEDKEEMKDRRSKTDLNCDSQAVAIEDHTETSNKTDNEHEVKGLQSHSTESIEVSEVHNGVNLEVSNQETLVRDQEAKKETPTVYSNQRPINMSEIITNIEAQFMKVCNSANEVSKMLEASKVQYFSTSNELKASQMLNPVALFHLTSFQSSSLRLFHNVSSSQDEGSDSSNRSDFSEGSCLFSRSHQSTLDRLCAWERKLYGEVKSAERLHLAYEKKCKQLRNQEVKGEDRLVVDKTKAAIRNLHTEIWVSIQSIKTISKRIKTLRDGELQPQLLALIKGLLRMWKVMAESHQLQKLTLDEAKLLLAAATATPPTYKLTGRKQTEPHQLTESTIVNLESEIRNWRVCFESWIAAQRSYMLALTQWFLRCLHCPDSNNTSQLPFSSPPIFGICIQWARFLDAVHEIPVMDGLDFFASGVRSLHAQLLSEDSRRIPAGSEQFGFSPDSSKNLEMVEVGKEDEVMTTADVAVRVLCDGMSVAVNSLIEFAVRSAEGYADLVKQWESTTWMHNEEGAGL